MMKLLKLKKTTKSLTLRYYQLKLHQKLSKHNQLIQLKRMVSKLMNQRNLLSLRLALQ